MNELEGVVNKMQSDADIIKRGPSKNAKWHMQRKAYTTCNKEKEQLIEYDSVADFYEARLKGGGAGGQEKTEKVHTEQSET